MDTYIFFHIITFLKKSHKWTGELRIGQSTAYFMEHYRSGAPQLTNNLKMADRRMKLWGHDDPSIFLSSFFPCRIFCAENFVIFVYEIKFMFTYSLILA